MGITDINVMEALLIALSGVLVVFMMLGILSVVIMVISRIVSAEPKENETVDAPVSEAAAPLDVPYGGTIKLLDVDEKTAACIMAIVSHETKIPLDQLVFKSIKALND